MKYIGPGRAKPSFSKIVACRGELDSGGAGDLGGAFDLGCERGGTYKVSRALDKADPLTSLSKLSAPVSACQQLSGLSAPVSACQGVAVDVRMYLFPIHHPSGCCA